jgi:hypothetical protein
MFWRRSMYVRPRLRIVFGQKFLKLDIRLPYGQHSEVIRCDVQFSMEVKRCKKIEFF